MILSCQTTSFRIARMDALEFEVVSTSDESKANNPREKDSGRIVGFETKSVASTRWRNTNEEVGTNAESNTKVGTK